MFCAACTLPTIRRVVNVCRQEEALTCMCSWRNMSAALKCVHNRDPLSGQPASVSPLLYTTQILTVNAHRDV